MPEELMDRVLVTMKKADAVIMNAMELIRDLLQALEHEREKTRWISVKELLPEVGEEVLVFGSYGFTYTCVARRVETLSNQPIEFFSPGEIHKDVTHWMPIPERPRMGE